MISLICSIYRNSCLTEDQRSNVWRALSNDAEYQLIWHNFFITHVRESLEIGLFILKAFHMLRWTLIFLVVAIVAALFGFTDIASGAVAIAKIFFYIFIVLFLLSLIAGGFRRSD